MSEHVPNRSIVWIVDDSALDADRARQALLGHYELRLFEDGGSALEALATCPRECLPQVLILDWLMPGVSGIDVCRYLSELPDETLRSVSVLLLTVHQRPGQVVEGLAAGASDFLSKPYAEEELRARVGALVRTRQLLARAERAEASLQHLLANSPDALVGIDGNGRITYVNPEAQTVLGKKPAELAGVLLQEVLPELRECEDGKGGAPQPASDVKVAGRLYAPLIRSSDPAGGGPRVVTLRDVTEQRRTEQTRLDLYAIVAHDLRSPLAAAAMRIETLVRGGQGPVAPPVLDGLHKLQRNLRELVALVNDFLEVARYEGGLRVAHPERVDLAQIAEETLDDFRPLADASRLTLRWRAEGDRTWVNGDPRRLKQAFSNLVANAIKFTPGEGRVEVSVTGQADRVVVAVRDTGRGIAADQLPEIFKRYNRAVSNEHDVSGTGLGLMIVRDTVQAHGGDVAVTSVQGEGSTFTFWLPAAA